MKACICLKPTLFSSFAMEAFKRKEAELVELEKSLQVLDSEINLRQKNLELREAHLRAQEKALKETKRKFFSSLGSAVGTNDANERRQKKMVEENQLEVAQVEAQLLKMQETEQTLREKLSVLNKKLSSLKDASRQEYPGRGILNL